MPRPLRPLLLLVLFIALAPRSASAAPVPGAVAPAHARSWADKLARALRYSTHYMAPQTAAQLERFLTPEAMTPMVAALVTGVVAQEVPVVGEVVDVGLLLWAVHAMGWEIAEAAEDFVRFAKAAILADTEEELEHAGWYFARFVARVGVDVAVAVLAHKVAKQLHAELQEAKGTGGGPSGTAPALAGAGGGGVSVAVPRYRVLADGTIVAVKALGAGLGGVQIHRRDGDEEETAAAGGAAQPAPESSAGGAAAQSVPPPPEGMSPALLALRQELHDPQAIAAFDGKFEAVNRNSAFAEKILGGLRQSLKEGESFDERMLQEGRKHKPQKGQALPPRLLAEIDAQLAWAERIGVEIEHFAKAHPDLPGMIKWRRDLEGTVETLHEIKQGPFTGGTERRIQGTHGPFIGLDAVLETAWEAKRVGGVERDFGYKDPKTGKNETANIDVVAEGGEEWIESKAGKASGKDLQDLPAWKEQALDQLEAAKQNPVNGKPPRVVFRFHRGVSRAAAAALRALGIEVRAKQEF